MIPVPVDHLPPLLIISRRGAGIAEGFIVLPFSAIPAPLRETHRPSQFLSPLYDKSPRTDS